MKLSQALATAAQDAGMNDVQIAAAVGVSQTTASRWLTGKREPRGSMVLALIKAVPGFGKLMGVEIAAA
ncbi:MAG TPA: helix-turn-helix transcriptional regulator [Candidatus Tumulicola sp.]|jgi:transcriptional regulator with XRE-family HTH domain